MRYIKCADCDHKYCEFCNAGDKYHKKAKSNAVTHFERIKAMSVEEMAESLYNIFERTRCMLPVECDGRCGNDRCKNCIKQYLESEVQEDE